MRWLSRAWKAADSSRPSVRRRWCCYPSSQAASTSRSSPRVASATHGRRRPRWSSAPRAYKMGTRMLASHEADVHANFKNAIMAAGDDGTVMLVLPGNPTMRVLRTGLAARAAAADPNVQLLGRITDLYFEGDMDASVANTGQVSSRITDLQPASHIVKQTWSEIANALREGNSRLGDRC